MSHKLLSNASFHEALFVLDAAQAHSCRQSGCGHCGGRLHVSDYARKPRGVPEAFRSYYTERRSFTCAQCRCRCTPPSARFFGRVRFVAGLAILIAALTRGPSERRCGQLEQIGQLYRIEAQIRDQQLDGQQKLDWRTQHSLPVVKAFWAWCEQQRQRMDLARSSPLLKALGYVAGREAALEVYLSDPDVQIDTNHLERALRPIPMGRRSWLFSWTEVGARHIGVIQSLLVTCRLHGVHPYVYLVDVLQRISQHPASRVDELTPRVWKDTFASNPLVSDLQRVGQ